MIERSVFVAKDMTKGKPLGLILSFTIPLLIGNLFQQLYSMADTFIVGRTIGVTALAAVGSTGSIMFLILGFAQGLTAGLAIPLAQKFGAKDEKGVRQSFLVSLLIAICVSIVLTVFSVVFCRLILETMRTPIEIIDQSESYLRVILAGLSASVAFNLLSNILRALGDSKTPLYFLVIACIMNIILDIVFIVVFKVGVAGAGFATIISQAFSAFACLVYIKRRLPILHFKREDLKVFNGFVMAHIRIAFPMAFQTSIIAIGALSIQITLNQLGANSVAAYTAAQKIDQLAILPLMSFGVTMATYTAQNFGAKLYQRIWDGVTTCIKLSLTFSVAIGIFLILFSPQLITLFVGPGQEDVIQLGRWYFITNSSMYFLLSLLFIYRYTLQGLGKSFIPTLAGIMELVMRMIAAIFLSQIFGFVGATMANPLAWLGAVIPLSYTYYSYKHKYIKNHKKKIERLA